MKNSSTPRVVFMGSPAFVTPVLDALYQNFNVVGVFSQPPRPSGRGQKLTPTPVHSHALGLNIPVFTPEKLKGDAFTTLADLKPDFICVAAYGLILRENVLNLAPCLNIHPSTLPRWRGAAPIHHTLLNGEPSLDVCLMHMEKGLDTGPVYHRTPLTIGADETTGDLLDKSFKTGAADLVTLLKNWPQTPIPQTEEGTTYAHKLNHEDRALNFNAPAQTVHNQIRALNPFPTATCTYEGETWKVLRSTNPAPCSQNAAPGTVLQADKTGIIVMCGAQTCLSLTQLQRPGKRAQNAAEFSNGLPDLVGKKLG